MRHRPSDRDTPFCVDMTSEPASLFTTQRLRADGLNGQSVAQPGVQLCLPRKKLKYEPTPVVSKVFGGRILSGNLKLIKNKSLDDFWSTRTPTKGFD